MVQPPPIIHQWESPQGTGASGRPPLAGPDRVDWVGIALTQVMEGMGMAAWAGPRPGLLRLRQAIRPGPQGFPMDSSSTAVGVQSTGAPSSQTAPLLTLVQNIRASLSRIAMPHPQPRRWQWR